MLPDFRRPYRTKHSYRLSPLCQPPVKPTWTRYLTSLSPPAPLLGSSVTCVLPSPSPTASQRLATNCRSGMPGLLTSTSYGSQRGEGGAHTRKLLQAAWQHLWGDAWVMLSSSREEVGVIIWLQGYALCDACAWGCYLPPLHLYLASPPPTHTCRCHPGPRPLLSCPMRSACRSPTAASNSKTSTAARSKLSLQG